MLPERGVNHTSSTAVDNGGQRRHGDVVALRYITSDGRIEICWPCRVVEDRADVVALFIAEGSPYMASPKKTAAQKRRQPLPPVPPDRFLWRNDTLRVMLPGRAHSVSLSWEPRSRRLLKYFVNMEEPFRRTPVGFDTQDHTLDIEATPALDWRWRDEQELANHVEEGFYTPALAAAARLEGERAIEAMRRREHACVRGWPDWRPPRDWGVPPFVAGWDTTPPTFWDKRRWAYGDDALRDG